jgi:hypothetical protein
MIYFKGHHIEKDIILLGSVANLVAGRANAMVNVCVTLLMNRKLVQSTDQSPPSAADLCGSCA